MRHTLEKLRKPPLAMVRWLWVGVLVETVTGGAAAASATAPGSERRESGGKDIPAGMLRRHLGGVNGLRVSRTLYCCLSTVLAPFFVVCKGVRVVLARLDDYSARVWLGLTGYRRGSAAGAKCGGRKGVRATKRTGCQ